ncbi:MAG TPA: hypothetical protein DHW42_08185 [Candidatus Marinimicrobia bacterium]|nr:hypothetical protein [Candidatus Neomarinimicrobiota bacterium]
MAMRKVLVRCIGKVEMKYILFSLQIIILLTFISCELFDINESPEIPDWYPSQLVLSENRLAEFDTIATDFAEMFELDKNDFVIDTLTSHIYRIYVLNIPVCTFTDSTDDFIEFNQKVTQFLQTWYRLFSIEYFEIDTMHYTGIEEGHHGAEIYIKSDYSIQMYDGSRSLGFIAVWMDGSGIITQLRSTLLPQLRVPIENIITLNEAKEILDGYKYSVYSWTGESEREFTVTGMEETAHEVYIDKNYGNDGNLTSVDYRLVWRITIFDGDFFVDSQTGEIIGFIQGWRS